MPLRIIAGVRAVLRTASRGGAMRMTWERRRSRLIVGTEAIGLASGLVAAGCGDDEEDTASSAAAPAATSAAAPATDEAATSAAATDAAATTEAAATSEPAATEAEATEAAAPATDPNGPPFKMTFDWGEFTLSDDIAGKLADKQPINVVLS